MTKSRSETLWQGLQRTSVPHRHEDNDHHSCVAATLITTPLLHHRGSKHCRRGTLGLVFLPRCLQSKNAWRAGFANLTRSVVPPLSSEDLIVVTPFCGTARVLLGTWSNDGRILRMNSNTFQHLETSTFPQPENGLRWLQENTIEHEDVSGLLHHHADLHSRGSCRNA